MLDVPAIEESGIDARPSPARLPQTADEDVDIAPVHHASIDAVPPSISIADALPLHLSAADHFAPSYEAPLPRGPLPDETFDMRIPGRDRYAVVHFVALPPFDMLVGASRGMHTLPRGGRPHDLQAAYDDGDQRTADRDSPSMPVYADLIRNANDRTSLASAALFQKAMESADDRETLRVPFYADIVAAAGLPTMTGKRTASMPTRWTKHTIDHAWAALFANASGLPVTSTSEASWPTIGSGERLSAPAFNSEAASMPARHANTNRFHDSGPNVVAINAVSIPAPASADPEEIGVTTPGLVNDDDASLLPPHESGHDRYADASLEQPTSFEQRNPAGIDRFTITGTASAPDADIAYGLSAAYEPGARWPNTAVRAMKTLVHSDTSLPALDARSDNAVGCTDADRNVPPAATDDHDASTPAVDPVVSDALHWPIRDNDMAGDLPSPFAWAPAR